MRGTVVDLDGRTTGNGRNLVAVLFDSDGLYVRGRLVQSALDDPQVPRSANRSSFPASPSGTRAAGSSRNPRVQVDRRGGRARPAARLLPRYGLTEGLSMDQMGRIVRAAVEAYAELVPDPMPAELARAAQTAPDCEQAIRELHLPKTLDEYETGRRRLIFDDLFEFQLGLALRRRSWKTRGAAPVLPTTAKIDARIRRLFPFAFTEGQNRAVREISDDLGLRPRHASPAAGRRRRGQDGRRRLRDSGGGRGRSSGGLHGADRSARQPALGHDRRGARSQPRQSALAHRAPRTPANAGRRWPTLPTGRVSWSSARRP